MAESVQPSKKQSRMEAAEPPESGSRATMPLRSKGFFSPPPPRKVVKRKLFAFLDMT
jgi:hypothetical protein